MTQRTIVAANRLPVRRTPDGWKRSPGGLVTALTPILQEHHGTWVGWDGLPNGQSQPFEHDGLDHLPVCLDQADIDEYYLGFCNATIWPLFHDAIRTARFRRLWWRAFHRVNQRFAEAVIQAATKPDDVIWIHDYQLLLVPQMVRRQLETARIDFFLHIPFPPPEVFARLPWRTQIIEGLLGADVVGFQTERAAGNFKRAAAEFADATETPDGLIHSAGMTRVVVAPISIDVEAFDEAARSERALERIPSIRRDLGDPDLIVLGVDRLDYTKGIDVRLEAFETLLEAQPELADTTRFVQISVPSRESIGDYAEMRAQIELIVGRINGAFGGRHHMPVHYIYESLPREDLVAYYRVADVMCVTPLADGMNLVAKEYVSSRINGDGVLMLSEFAGAANELPEAVLVNPYDIDGMARAMSAAFAMDEKERRRRMAAMRTTVANNDVHHWAAAAMGTDLLVEETQ